MDAAQFKNMIEKTLANLTDEKKKQLKQYAEDKYRKQVMMNDFGSVVDSNNDYLTVNTDSDIEAVSLHVNTDLEKHSEKTMVANFQNVIADEQIVNEHIKSNYNFVYEISNFTEITNFKGIIPTDPTQLMAA